MSDIRLESEYEPVNLVSQDLSSRGTYREAVRAHCERGEAF